MQGVPDEIKRRQVALFALCDPAYGAGVAKAVKLDPAGDDRLKGTSATDEPEESIDHNLNLGPERSPSPTERISRNRRFHEMDSDQ